MILLTGCKASGSESEADPSEPLAIEQVFDVGQPFELQAPADDPIGVAQDLVPWAGGFAVVDRIASNVKVFEADGSYRMTLSGPGDGPGELRRPVRAAHLLDGRLAVLDSRGRVVLFDSAGETARQWEMNGGPFSGIAVAPSTGDLVVAARLFEDPTTLVPSPLAIHRFGSDGEPRGMLPEPADTLSPAEYSYAARKMAVVGDVVVSGLQSRNVLTHQDLSTLERRVFEAGTSFWKPIDWTDPAATRSPAAMAEWARDKVWFVKPEPVDSARYVAMFHVPVAGGGDFRLQYVLMDVDGRELAVTEPTQWGLHGSREGKLYATETDDAGDYHVIPLQLRPEFAKRE